VTGTLQKELRNNLAEVPRRGRRGVHNQVAERPVAQLGPAHRILSAAPV
jgi:hypothetical protein